MHRAVPKYLGVAGEGSDTSLFRQLKDTSVANSRLVNLAHPAPADEREDFVRSQKRPCGLGHGGLNNLSVCAVLEDSKAQVMYNA